MAIESRWHYGHELLAQEAEYLTKPHPSLNPVITAFGNMQYPDFLRYLKGLWSEAHPEIRMQAHSSGNTYDANKGYLVYSLVQRVPVENNRKPIPRGKIVDDDGEPFQIYTQSFDTVVKFTAIHGDPDTAEAIIDELENFMIPVIPALIRAGLQQIVYFQRYSDQQDERMGKDVATRSLAYRLTTQKILPIYQSTIDAIDLHLDIMDGATPSGTYIEVKDI